MNPPALTIVSGGQTGADRAGLDFAIEHGIAHAGWCPRGRKAEDGPIDLKYKLRESTSADYTQRTEWNVRDSDATVVFTMAKEATGGSKKTIEYAQKHKKPCLHLWPGIDAVKMLQEFMHQHHPEILNIAGSRASKEPEVAGFVIRTLQNALN